MVCASGYGLLGALVHSGPSAGLAGSVEVPLCTEIICCSCSLFNILQTSCKSLCAPAKLMSSHLKEKSSGKLSEKEVGVFLNISSPGCLCSHRNWLWSQVSISYFYFHTKVLTIFLTVTSYRLIVLVPVSAVHISSFCLLVFFGLLIPQTTRNTGKRMFFC